MQLLNASRTSFARAFLAAAAHFYMSAAVVGIIIIITTTTTTTTSIIIIIIITHSQVPPIVFTRYLLQSRFFTQFRCALTPNFKTAFMLYFHVLDDAHLCRFSTSPWGSGIAKQV